MGYLWSATRGPKERRGELKGVGLWVPSDADQRICMLSIGINLCEVHQAVGCPVVL